MNPHLDKLKEYASDLRVLFVDDNTQAQEELKDIFSTCFSSFDVASNGFEGFEKHKLTRYDIIISDIRMPQMDGIEMVRKIKELSPTPSIIIISAHEDIHYLKELINLGVDSFVIKPIHLEQLFKTVWKESEKIANQKELQSYREQLEELVETRTKQVEEMDRFYSIGKYTASIVHNINNPLLGLSGVTELLKDLNQSETINSFQLEKLTLCLEKGIVELKKLVQTITHNVRAQSVTEDQKVNLHEVIKSSIDFWRMDKNFRVNIDVHLDLKCKIPFIHGQEIHFTQVFSNLIKNAIDAMENSQDKQLLIHTHSEKGRSYIEISDTGSGISETHMNKIFDSNFTTKSPGKGTGLGLPICKQMIESYKGTLSVKPNEVGTTFVIMLPPYSFSQVTQIIEIS